MDEETDQVADLARSFFEKECAPHEPQWCDQQHVDRRIWNRAGELGLLCMSIPEQYGGGGGNFGHEAVVLIEQVRALSGSLGLAVHSGIVCHYVLAYGSEEQKSAWLPKMASGEMVGAIAMTEPGTGSDLQAVATKAVLDGDEYVINGSKTFISNGLQADLVIVVAKTGAAEGASGVSLIVVETDGLAGFSRGRNLEKIGMHGQDTCELFFDDVRVPRSNLLGDAEGEGFIQLMQQLPQERLVIAVAAAAVIEKSVELAVEYSKDREAFGRAVFDFQNSRFVLAECDTISSVAWAFLDDCVAKHMRGELDITGAAKAKLWLTDQQCVVADRCLQIFGGYGFMREYPISQLFVDSRVQKIYGGTNEIMKEIISRSL
jgi:long-chain-acyl-CoA dehydrogenase